MKIIGSQLSFAAAVLRENTAVSAGKRDPATHKATLTLIMQVIISLAVLGGAFYLLRHPGSPTQEKAVWTAFGTVIGYWLH
jgi:hypothetical protein